MLQGNFLDSPFLVVPREAAAAPGSLGVSKESLERPGMAGSVGVGMGWDRSSMDPIQSIPEFHGSVSRLFPYSGCGSVSV